MNYEDRTDLKDPRDILSPHLRAMLSHVDSTNNNVDEQSFTDPIELSKAAKAVFDKKTESETNAKGAPPEVDTVCKFMLSAGYSFGTKLVSSSAPAEIDPATLLKKANHMYLNDLCKYIPRQSLIEAKKLIATKLTRLVGVDNNNFYSLEEASNEWWWFGVAVALIERDTT